MNEVSDTPKRRLLLVHGHGPSPDADFLMEHWRAALRQGLKRDHGGAGALKRVEADLFYYADDPLFAPPAGYDPEVDRRGLEATLQALAARDKARLFRRKHYEDLPGKSSTQEFLVDAGASLGLGRFALNRVAPEIDQYFREGRASLLPRFEAWLESHLASGAQIMLICHGLGALVAYDALWRLSNEAGLSGHVERWVTFGAPLADNSVRKRLLGAAERGAERYPGGVIEWHNIAAEDDPLCHDMTVADDYRGMLAAKRISAIHDHAIYNLAVSYGKSDPRAHAGYLVHPRMAQILAEWLG